MYECPNCAGNLKFDIARQQLHCEYCGTMMDPYQVSGERDAEEKAGEYEVTVFTCPQCGGEILSEDTTAATFCSFCGSSAILDSRISKGKRPGYIIPFTRTKEDCREAYKKMLRRAPFVPDDMKKEAQIEKFRGIYMPFWVYSFEKKGNISFSGKRSRRKGDYRITDHYRIECAVEAEYHGLAYDASAAFSDSLSNAIGPFDLKEGKTFVPSFLSGFYADTNDVESYVYEREAQDLVVRDTASCLGRDAVCRKYHVGQDGEDYVLKNALLPSERMAELAMLPVWFLSCKSKDRVSYAVVNGQTGKAAADLPVDKKKYMLGSLLLAVPLFFLLNLFFTITPAKILVTAALLALACILISNRQISHIISRESGEDDRGLASVKPPSRGEDAAGKRRRPGIRWPEGAAGKIILMLLAFYLSALVPGIVIAIAGILMGGILPSGVVAVIIITILASIFFVLRRALGKPSGRRSGSHFKEKWSTLVKPFGGMILAVIILMWNPVSDWFYYMGAFVCMGLVLWAILDIIKQHNLLTTRRLPQFNRRGGDLP